MSDLKRIAAPRLWPIERKHKKYIISPRPGAHRRRESLPLGVIIRDVLGYAHTLREVRKVLATGAVRVDGIVRKDHRFAVGLMDVITMGEKSYRLMPGKSRLFLAESGNAIKLLRLRSKKVLRNGRVQLNFHDGRNMIAGKDRYCTGDVILWDAMKKSVTGVIKFELGNRALIIRGINVGRSGEISGIVAERSSGPNKVRLKSGSKTIEVPQDYIFMVGDTIDTGVYE